MESWYKQAQNIDLLGAEVADPGTSSARLKEIYFDEFRKRPTLYREKIAQDLFSHPNCPAEVLTDAILRWTTPAAATKKGAIPFAMETVFSNSNTPTESLARAFSILKKESRKKKNQINPLRALIENAMKSILSNVACPVDILSSELVSGNPVFQAAAFENPSTPASAKIQWVHSKGVVPQPGQSGAEKGMMTASIKTASKKILYVMRGISGSGKSTKAKSLPGVVPENIFSTDDLIAEDPEGYDKFFQTMKETGDWTPLNKKHKHNIGNLVSAMKTGKGPLVYDDTNLAAWNCKEAVEEAIKMGYKVEFIDVGTGGLNAEELAKRNKHNVPLDEIRRMIAKYEEEGPLSIAKVMKSVYPFSEDDETKPIPPGIQTIDKEELTAKLGRMGVLKCGQVVKRVIVDRYGDHRVVIGQSIRSRSFPIVESGN